MTSGVTGPQNFSTTTVQDSGRTTGSSPSSAVHTNNGRRSDTIGSTDGTQSYVPPDIDPISGLPKLPLPTDAKPQAEQNLPDLQQYATPDQLYSQKLQQLLSQLEAKDASLANKVYFVLTHPGTALPSDYSKAKDYALQFQQQATSHVKTTTGNSTFKPPAPDTARADEALAFQRNSIFEKLVNDLNSLGQEDKNKLLLAHYHPDSLPKGAITIKLHLMLKSLEAKAESLFDKSDVAPVGYNVPKSSADFDMKNSYAFTEAFLNAAKGMSPPLTQQEINYLRYQINHPEGPKPPLPPGKSEAEMQALFKKTFGNAQEMFTKQTGFPSSYKPTVNSEVYDALLLGRFEDAFETLLAKQSPPLTDAQKALMRTALGQQTENIPKEILALFEMIKGSALAEVIKAFDLPPSWNPKTRNLNDPAVIQQRAQIEMQMNGVKAAQEMIASLQTVVNQMPNGPTKATYSMYLKAVGEALNKFADSMFESAAADSDAARRLTIVTRDAEKDRIKHQQHDVDEARKKEKKAAKLNMFLGVIMAIFTGGFGIALFIQKQKTGSNFLEKMIQKIMESIDNMKGAPGFIKALLKTIAHVVILLAIFFISPAYFLLKQLPESFSAIISDWLQAAGLSKSKADMAAMIISTAALIILEILIMILTAGAASGALIGSFSQMATTIANIAKTVAKTVMNALKSLKSFLIEVLSMMHKMSAKARALVTRLQKATNELEHLLSVAQKAASKAKNAPLAQKADKIAAAEKAFLELSEKMKEVQDITTKLSRQLGMESMTNPELLKVAQAASKQAKDLQKVAMEIAELSGDITKAAARGSRSAQRIEKNIDLLIKGFSVFSVGMTVVSTSVGVARELLLGQVARIKAEMEADNIKIRAIIKQIRAIIEALISGVSASTETVKRIQETQANKFPDFNFVC